jgi:hypothetical protein
MTSPTLDARRHSIRMKRSALVAIWLVAACATPIDSTLPTVVPTARSLTPSLQPTLISPSPSEDADVFTGVVEVQPDGWSDQSSLDALVGFPNTAGRVYGPDGITVPPHEGPGRLAFYETFPADNAFLESRIDASRKHGGRAQAVAVNGDAAEVWLDETTGELLLGWTLPGKSEVLVANTADFTVARLVKSAESVSDCCG